VQDERLRMLFSFQTMYLGLSPKQAIWVYGILTYMESGEGVWYPRGGMYRLVKALCQIATEEGAVIQTDAPVSKVLVENGAAKGVQLASGERIDADWVVLNVDVPTAYRTLLPPTPLARKQWRNSCSTLMFYIGYRGSLPHLLHHNVYFSEDFERNLRELFDEQKVPSQPSFYVCLSNRTDADDAPPGCENVYVLVPVPNLEGEPAEAHRDRILQYVMGRVGMEPSRIEFAQTLTPQGWAQLGLWQGATFGIAHTFFQSTSFRPSVRAPFRNLYLVGASTHPGNGIPMVLMASELATAAIDRG
jgi:phytoene desaturase